MISMCVPAALRLVHKSGCPDCPAADWPALLLSTKGVFLCVCLYKSERKKQKKSEFTLSIIYLPRQCWHASM